MNRTEFISKILVKANPDREMVALCILTISNQQPRVYNEFTLKTSAQINDPTISQ